MPIFKLATLALRSLSRPIAQHVKIHLKENTKFTTTMTKLGSEYQKIISKISNEPKIISTDRAVDIGSEIVVELMLFGMFGSIIIYDHYRTKDENKKIQNRLVDLEDFRERVVMKLTLE